MPGDSSSLPDGPPGAGWVPLRWSPPRGAVLAPADSGTAGSGLLCPRPRVADSELMAGDTDTKERRGAGGAGAVRAEKQKIQ